MVNLDRFRRLLMPESIAIIGSLSHPGKFGAKTRHHLEQAGYRGALYPVSTVAELREAVDVAVVAVPAAAVPEVLAEVGAAAIDGRRRAENVIVYSSGFSEAQGEALMVPEGGPSLLGPNTVGVYWAQAKAVISFAQAFDSLMDCPHGSGIVIISQSGAFGARMVTAARRRGLIIDGFIATGNEDGYTAASCVEGLLGLGDDRPRVIGMYLESVPDPVSLHRALDAARAAQISVVVLRGGRSAAGAHAAASHTAAVSPPDQILDAMLRLDGVVTVVSDREFIDAMAAVSLHDRAPSRRVVILTGSGGAGVVAADGVSNRGCALPQPSAGLADHLADALPPYAAIGNPIDVTAQVIGDAERLSDLIETLGRSGEYDSALVIGRAEQAHLLDRRGRHHGLAVITAVLDGSEAMTAEALGSAVGAFGDLGAAVHAIAALSTPRGVPTLVSENSTAAPKWGDAGPDDTARSLQRLAGEGIAVAPWEAVHDVVECAAIGERLGFPVVVKANLAAHEHKAAVGGIRLDVGCVEELERAVTAMAARADTAQRDTSSPIPMAVVARQLRGGPELFVGVRWDEQFGYVMAMGLGGSAMELINRSIAVPTWSPLSWIEAELMHQVFQNDSRWTSSARAQVDLGRRLLAIAQRERTVLIECNPVVMIDGQLIALDARVLLPTPLVLPHDHHDSDRRDSDHRDSDHHDEV